MIQVVFLLVIALISVTYFWAWKRQRFWKDHNIPHIPGPILLGNIVRAFFFKEHISTAIARLYHHPNAKDQPFVGFNLFYKPAILITDPELIKRILVRDFNYFSNHYSGFDVSHDPMGANNMFQIKNPTWKNLRANLNPLFSPAKMKQMFPIVMSIGKNLNKRVQLACKGNEDVDARMIAGAFTLDSISLVLIATETHSLLLDKPSDFLMMMAAAFSETFWSKLSFSTVFLMPEFGRFLKMKSFGIIYTETIRKLFHETCTERIKNGKVRGDLIDALIAIKSDSTFFKDKCEYLFKLSSF